jgi:hypothetical protein
MIETLTWNRSQVCIWEDAIGKGRYYIDAEEEKSRQASVIIDCIMPALS